MKKRTLTKAQAAILTSAVAMASPLAFAHSQLNPTALQNPLVVAVGLGWLWANDSIDIRYER